jgi:hypothetical protein
MGAQCPQEPLLSGTVTFDDINFAVDKNKEASIIFFLINDDVSDFKRKISAPFGKPL